MTGRQNILPLVRAGIDTYRKPVVFMREDCHLCGSEGFTLHARIEIEVDGKRITTTRDMIAGGDWLPPDTAALGNTAWDTLTALLSAVGRFSQPEPPVSTSAVRTKDYGGRFDDSACRVTISDTTQKRLSDIKLAAFIISFTEDRMHEPESIALTLVMRNAGARPGWGMGSVLDRPCAGELPGNRTTPVVVAIVAAPGHLIPADDMLIRIERRLDFDSKKTAAGSSRVPIGMPIRPAAKGRSEDAAKVLSDRLLAAAGAPGRTISIRRKDGSVPVGRGVGPALEAHDVLAVLGRSPRAPNDLRERTLDVARALPDLVEPNGREDATDLVDTGVAEAKFTKLASASGRKTTGVLSRACVGETVEIGQPLFEVHAERRGELDWALDHVAGGDSPFRVEDAA